ncbi:hypothetical protein PTKIN_Ptkin02bG0077600 [Pterospermum kingtungense]
MTNNPSVSAQPQEKSQKQFLPPPALSSSSSFKCSPTITNPVVSCSLKRKRLPKIQIPSILQEIQPNTPKLKDATHQVHTALGVGGVKGKKKFMEDTHKIVSFCHGNTNKAFFGVYDGHGGTMAAEFVAENLHNNVFEMLKNCKGNEEKEEAVKAGYFKTDEEFLKQDLVSGTCCVTALIEGQDIVVPNLGRLSLESSWDTPVSRSIGDAHLKDWVPAEPDTKIFQLTPAMEFLVLASDGLWQKVSNQEAVDTVTRLLVGKRLGTSGSLCKENDEDYGCVNVSPSTKIRRVSLVKQPKETSQSPRYKRNIDNENDFGCENGSPPSKFRRISLVKRINMKPESPSQEKTSFKKRPSSAGLMAACKELASLAVNRGSLDDITIMIIDLNHFKCSNT